MPRWSKILIKYQENPFTGSEVTREPTGSQNCMLLPGRPEEVDTNETNGHDPCWRSDSGLYVSRSVLKTSVCLAEHGDRY
jgi:hypothetical protein